jgi:hypothetical protein
MSTPRKTERGTRETLLTLLSCFQEVEYTVADAALLGLRSRVLVALRDAIDAVELRDRKPWPRMAKNGEHRYTLAGMQLLYQERLADLAADVRSTILDKMAYPSWDDRMALVERVDRATYELAQPETLLAPRKRA